MEIFDKIFGKKSDLKPKPSEDSIRLIDSDITEAISEIYRLREFFKFVEINAKKANDIAKKMQRDEKVTLDEVDQIQWSYLWDNPIEWGFLPNKKFVETLSLGGFTYGYIRLYCRWVNSPILSDKPVTRREAIGFIIKNCIVDLNSGIAIEQKKFPFKEFVMANIAVRDEMSKTPTYITGTKIRTTINLATKYDLYDLADEWDLFINGTRWNYDINQYLQDKRKMENENHYR
jgi:hypothetical protein